MSLAHTRSITKRKGTQSERSGEKWRLRQGSDSRLLSKGGSPRLTRRRCGNWQRTGPLLRRGYKCDYIRRETAKKGGGRGRGESVPETGIRPPAFRSWRHVDHGKDTMLASISNHQVLAEKQCGIHADLGHTRYELPKRSLRHRDARLYSRYAQGHERLPVCARAAEGDRYVVLVVSRRVGAMADSEAIDPAMPRSSHHVAVNKSISLSTAGRVKKSSPTAGQSRRVGRKRQSL